MAYLNKTSAIFLSLIIVTFLSSCSDSITYKTVEGGKKPLPSHVQTIGIVDITDNTYGLDTVYRQIPKTYTGTNRFHIHQINFLADDLSSNINQSGSYLSKKVFGNYYSNNLNQETLATKICSKHGFDAILFINNYSMGSEITSQASRQSERGDFHTVNGTTTVDLGLSLIDKHGSTIYRNDFSQNRNFEVFTSRIYRIEDYIRTKNTRNSKAIIDQSSEAFVRHFAPFHKTVTSKIYISDGMGKGEDMAQNGNWEEARNNWMNTLDHLESPSFRSKCMYNIAISYRAQNDFVKAHEWAQKSVDESRFYTNNLLVSRLTNTLHQENYNMDRRQ